MFIVGLLLGLASGVAAVLAVQALAEHKSFGTAAHEDGAAAQAETRKLLGDVLTEVKKLTGKL